MAASNARTAQPCDNCQTEAPTACLDIGKGVATQLCATCWARLMTWRQRQNTQQQRPTFAILPWPLAAGGASRPTGTDGPPPTQRRRRER